MNRRYVTPALAAAVLAPALAWAWPQEWLGENIAPADFAAAWGVNPAHAKKRFSSDGSVQVYLVQSSIPANILWPGDKVAFTLQFTNLTDQPLKAKGKAWLIQYEVFTYPDDVFHIGVRKVADISQAPFEVSLDPKGWQDIVLTPDIPEKLGGYALILELEGHDRLFGATCVRTPKPDPKPRQFYRLTMDMGEIAALSRLGATVNRVGIGYAPTTDKNFEEWYARETKYLKELKEAGLPVCIEFGGGAFRHPNQPLGRERPWLNDRAMMLDTKFDLAWLPSWDADFKKFVKKFCVEFGWPKGPVNAIKLWNEPWNGISISGWGADDERYREIYTVMGQARDEAQAEAGVQVLIGGCDSSSNTFDKLFADGSDKYLKWLDFLSIHYQGTDPHTTVKQWVNRRAANGEPARVLVWDTESWVANSDDRIAGVLSAMYSFGQDRVVGVQSDNVVTAVQWRDVKVQGAAKPERRKILQTWSPGAAVGAFQHFVGERAFRELLFKNGLPFVMVFDGEGGNAEDSTVVVLGDLGTVFGYDNVSFRTCRSLAEVAKKEELRRQLAGLAADAPERAKIEEALHKPMPYEGATMTLAAGGDTYALYDFYGNRVAAKDNAINVPLDSRGFYLRGDGKPGSFAALIEALKKARVAGFEPFAKVCRDMTSPVDKQPVLRLELTNVLNRAVNGALNLKLGELQVDCPQQLSFQPHETRNVDVKVTGGKANPNNVYPLSFVFDAGADGRAVHQEEMHVNCIAKRTITVDGALDDWKDVLPQQVKVEGVQEATLTEKAWLPFMKFDESVKKGFAVGYIAYDDANFYFAAKISDTTPHPGTVRFETRDDSEYFYPEKCFAPVKKGSTQTAELVWPEGVRHYSYRKNPVLPCGSAPGFDNVQIGFNVLPEDQKPLYPFPPGTMRGYTGYSCTDYEYALNKVAEQYGGGVEIWRLRKPDMPHKHFYPRQPKSPADGPVKDGKLVVTHEGGTRTVECSLPWSEIPEVKKKLDAGQPIKFSFRVNDDAGVGCMELAKERSVARRNGSFRADWVEHWANELEFGWDK